MRRSENSLLEPRSKPEPVVGPGEFVIAAAFLEHGHIYGQCSGLVEAGAELRWVYDPDPLKVQALLERYPSARVAQRFEQILDDPEVKLVTAAGVPCERGAIGCRVMQADKDYFVDKTPFTSLTQLEEAKRVAARTRRKYAVYYSERLHSECAVFAGQLIADGQIGRVVTVTGFGPHRLGPPTARPEWFFRKSLYGGILTDIGSHQIEQYLEYAGASDAEVVGARAANTNHVEFPEFEDFGEAHLIGDNGSSNYFRVDWLTPRASSIWGDGRTFIVGTAGHIELRKFIDVCRDNKGDHIYLVNKDVEARACVAGKVGFPYFGKLILDCLNRSETAMTQKHAFKAAELCLRAQEVALASSAQGAYPPGAKRE
jgi:predicted dehydrogenase